VLAVARSIGYLLRLDQIFAGNDGSRLAIEINDEPAFPS
jgi:hypothetical protein